MTPSPSSEPPVSRLPWRSAACGWVLTAGLLLAGVPLFLRMPPWCDITLYDQAADAVLSGGVHYRDVFDTNMPGFVWVLAVLRACFGWSVEVLRALDLLIVGAVLVLLGRLARAGGGSPASVAWMFAGAAAFYPFSSEMCHAQRDVWLLLPAAAAVAVRLGGAAGFRRGFAEGVVWGCGVWLKPHIVLLAGLVWVLTIHRLVAREPRPWRAAGRNLGGCVAGGLVVGAAGVGWLVGTGTWPYFVDVFEAWNPYYLRLTMSELDSRLDREFSYFPVWSWVFAGTIPLAVVAVADGLFARAGGDRGPVGRVLPGWVFASAPTPEARFRRAVLAVLFLGWAGQAAFVQQAFHYIHVPEIFLAIAVLASTRWAIPALVIAWFAAASAVHGACGEPLPRTSWYDPPPQPGACAWLPTPHPAADMTRAAWWPSCWRTGLTSEQEFARREGVAFDRHASAIGWSELAECTEFLRSADPPLRDGDLICWDDSTHPLYLMTGARPRFRFMHISTIIRLGDPPARRMFEEATAAEARARYAVSDLARHSHSFPPEMKAAIRDRGPDLLPPVLPEGTRAAFPFDHPAVFRSRGGRYVVHLLRPPGNEPGR